jgi:hypothetical protein
VMMFGPLSWLTVYNCKTAKMHVTRAKITNATKSAPTTA